MIEKLYAVYLSNDDKPSQREVCSQLGISINQLKTLLVDDNKDDLEHIQEVRVLHRSIKKRSGQNYEFNGLSDFYNWYEKTDKSCCYCGITGEELEAIWLNGWRTKRRRGRKLEVERVDSFINKYSSQNCKFACYFCNNHKSDIISQEHYEKFFKDPMVNYLRELTMTKNPNTLTKEHDKWPAL